jgi:hypothetical protein
MPQPLHRVLASLAFVVWRIRQGETRGTGNDCRSRRNGSYAFHKINEYLMMFHNFVWPFIWLSWFPHTIAGRRYKPMATSQKNGDVWVAIA